PASLSARDLVTVLGNLIDNAVDAAQGTTRARVTVTAFTDDAVLVLRVADTGAGVDPSHAEQVFQRGWSTKPAGPAGRGLGLALVRQTVLRHAGTLTVREAPGGGAEFEARLPLVTTAMDTGSPSDPASASGPGSGSGSVPHQSVHPGRPTRSALHGGDV
ncbi:sensor histidine kinase, partial [Streptomyces sp. NPDC127574]